MNFYAHLRTLADVEGDLSKASETTHDQETRRLLSITTEFVKQLQGLVMVLQQRMENPPNPFDLTQKEFNAVRLLLQRAEKEFGRKTTLETASPLTIYDVLYPDKAQALALFDSLVAKGVIMRAARVGAPYEFTWQAWNFLQQHRELL